VTKQKTILISRSEIKLENSPISKNEIVEISELYKEIQKTDELLIDEENSSNKTEIFIQLNKNDNKKEELLKKILAQLLLLPKSNKKNKLLTKCPTQLSSFNDIKCLTFKNNYYFYPKQIYLPHLRDYMPKLALNMFPRYYYNKHGAHLYYRQFNQMYFRSSNTSNYYYHQNNYSHSNYYYYHRSFY
jgi:hypothetical protein